MRLPSALRIPLAITGLGLGGYFLFMPPTDSPERTVAFSDENLEVVPDDDLSELDDELALEAPTAERVLNEADKAAPPSQVRPPIELDGRVVDAAGNGIAGAKVSLYLRRSLAAFRARGTESPRPERGSRGEERGGRGRRRTREAARGRFGGAGSREELREMFRLRRVSETVTTGEDGHFKFRGTAYAQTTLQLAATHESFAPAVVQREWKMEQGALRLEDIVLQQGGSVFGFVVAKHTGSPIEGAELTYEVSRSRREETRGNGQRTPANAATAGGRGERRRGRRGVGGNGAGRRGGRVEEGAGTERRGRGRGGNRRGWRTGRALARLLPKAKTDARGAFELRNLPKGAFRLQIEKDRYLPGSSDTFEVVDQRAIDAGRIQLELGLALTGTVRDAGGQPIAKAVVKARVSREVAMREFGLRRGGSTALPGRAERGRGGPRGRRGRRGGDNRPEAAPGRERGGRRADLGNLMQLVRYERETRTKEDGTFTLDGLPKPAVQLQVEHRDFIEEERDPVDPLKTPRVDITMYRRLAIDGVVVDAAGGKPIEHYGIAARRIGAEGADGRGRRDTGRSGGFGRGGPQGRGEAVRQLLERFQGRGGRGRGPGGNPGAGGRSRQGTGTAGGGTGNGGQGSPAGGQRAPGRRGRQGDERQRSAEQEARAARRSAELQARMAELQARMAERQALVAQEEAFRKQRLGPSGLVARSAPKPEKHEAGRFRLGGLEPGQYVLDVHAPGYALQAVGPVELERGKPVAAVQASLVAGAVLTGLVQDKKTGKPIERATLELSLPRATRAPPGRGSFRGPRSTRVDRVRTDAEGRFSFAAQRAGTFDVVVRARDHLERKLSNVLVKAGGEDLVVRLGTGGRVFGTVRGADAKERLSVVFTNEAGETQQVRVSREDASYEVRNLEPGGYRVHVVDGRGERRGGRFGGELGGGFGARFRRGGMNSLSRAAEAAKNAPPDVQVQEGSEQRFDLDARKKLLGIVKGTVFKNGVPAARIEVLLQPKQETPDESRRGRRGGRGSLSARTGGDGAFEIRSVPAGVYTLEVLAGSSGRGRGGSRGFGGRFGASALHREEIQLREGGVYQRQFEFTVSDAVIEVRDAKTGQPASRANVALVLAAEAAGKEPAEWRRLPSLRWARTRDGTAKVENLQPGSYRYNVFGGRIVAKTGEFSVGRGTTKLQVTVEVKPEDPKQGEPGGQPPGRGRRQRSSDEGAPRGGARTGGRRGGQSRGDRGRR